ncbi:hypothetical protein [Rhodobaculum claviforme]|nr:hypothetical protein [Rhodobaculum claviforme]
MLAGTLAAGGVHLGRVLDASFTLNPTGLREPEVLVHMHEHLLETNGGAWHRPPDRVVWGKLHTGVRDLFIEARAAAAPPGRPWGFKEPRTLLVAEGWIEALEDWRGVGIFRHPAEVAASLAQRNGFDRDRALGLWLAYNRRLLALQRAHGLTLMEFGADRERMRADLAAGLLALGCDVAAAGQVHDAAIPRHAGVGTDAPLPDAVAEVLAALRAAARGPGRVTPPPRPVPPPAASPPVPRTLADLHSMRLFPRDLGAAAYIPSGIAARCDWVVLSDVEPPQATLVRLCDTDRPRHVFVSLRNPSAALRFFFERVLPEIPGPFVLISGSQDVTVPVQTDRRWRPFDARERAWIEDLLADPRLIRWFAENLDTAGHPRMEPMPVGMIWPAGVPDPDAPLPVPAPLGPRPLRVLCAHRIREGVQWQARRDVSALAAGSWAAFSTLPDRELSEAEFAAQLAAHSFVLCVEGGGLDPSPKAWTVLLHGAIPILRDTPVAAAYRGFPVVVVPEWSADALTPARLGAWKASLRPSFEDPVRRARVLARLGIAHWWKRVSVHVPPPPQM